MGDDCCAHEATACSGPPPLVLPTQLQKEDKAGCGSAEASCCLGGVAMFDGMDARYRRMLWTVIAINGATFLTENDRGSASRLASPPPSSGGCGIEHKGRRRLSTRCGRFG
jgi:hypothetical protein